MIYFADTAFWVALSLKRDQHHATALSWHRSILRSGGRLVTTEAVLWEWMNALSGVNSRQIAAELYRRIALDPAIEVVPFDSFLIAAALERYRERVDKSWSLTDCLSFVVMERYQLKDGLRWIAISSRRIFERSC